MFYTYLWLREDGTPYYAGKGSGNRAYHHHKRIGGKAPTKDRVIVYPADSETDAFETEIALIWYYGRKDLGLGCLCNNADGGEGPAGRACTEKAKILISQSLKEQGIKPPKFTGHTESTKARIKASMTKFRASKPARMSSCHPDRIHWGKGMCLSCYNRSKRRLDAIFRKTQASMG